MPCNQAMEYFRRVSSTSLRPDCLPTLFWQFINIVWYPIYFGALPTDNPPRKKRKIYGKWKQTIIYETSLKRLVMMTQREKLRSWKRKYVSYVQLLHKLLVYRSSCK